MLTHPRIRLPEALRPSLFQLWAGIAMALLFSILLWHPSRAAAMNIMDLVFFLPALVFAPAMLVRQRLLSRELALAALPLLLYIGYALVSITWSDTPNASRSIRAALQLLAALAFFSWLIRTGQGPLLKRLLLTGCLATAAVCAWHLFTFYGLMGHSWSRTLYADSDTALLTFGLKPMNVIAATLVVVPQTALLAALLQRHVTGILLWIGLLALAVMLMYLVAMERRTGQVALAATLVTGCLIFRNRIWIGALVLALASAALALWATPEWITSRGTSWRPEIWASSFQRSLEWFWFGQGLSNTMEPVPVVADDGTVRSFVHPHSMVLSVLHYLGITGVVLWLLLWAPPLLRQLASQARAETAFITMPLIAGITALVFDGGYAMAAFDYDWFCFWGPVTLLLASQAESLRS